MHLKDKNNFSRHTIAFRCCLDLGCFYCLKKKKGSEPLSVCLIRSV